MFGNALHVCSAGLYLCRTLNVSAQFLASVIAQSSLLGPCAAVGVCETLPHASIPYTVGVLTC